MGLIILYLSISGTQPANDIGLFVTFKLNILPPTYDQFIVYPQGGATVPFYHPRILVPRQTCVCSRVCIVAWRLGWLDAAAQSDEHHQRPRWCIPASVHPRSRERGLIVVSGRVGTGRCLVTTWAPIHGGWRERTPLPSVSVSRHRSFLGAPFLNLILNIRWEIQRKLGREHGDNRTNNKAVRELRQNVDKRQQIETKQDIYWLVSVEGIFRNLSNH